MVVSMSAIFGHYAMNELVPKIEASDASAGRT